MFGQYIFVSEKAKVLGISYRFVGLRQKKMNKKRVLAEVKHS